MGQYLDDNGLRYLWTKIKNIFVAKESGKGLSSNDYTTTEKNKLAGIANNANNYSLPTASASTLGGIKVGSGLSISNGILSASGGLQFATVEVDFNSMSDGDMWTGLDREMTVQFPFAIKMAFVSFGLSTGETLQIFQPGYSGEWDIKNGSTTSNVTVTFSSDGLSFHASCDWSEDPIEVKTFYLFG